MNETETRQEPQKKGWWRGFAELGPAWIAALATVIGLVIGGGAGYTAGHVTATPTPTPKAAPRPTVTVTATVTPPSNGNQGTTSPSPSDTAGNGTVLGAYSFRLTNGFTAPLGPTMPTQAEVTGSNVAYDLYFNGQVEPGGDEKMIKLADGSVPSYSACTAGTAVVGSVPPDQGTAVCIIETSGRVAGVTVTSVGSSPFSLVFKVTVWQYVQ
jgi:hypothetical protein